MESPSRGNRGEKYKNILNRFGKSMKFGEVKWRENFFDQFYLFTQFVLMEGNRWGFQANSNYIYIYIYLIFAHFSYMFLKCS